MALLRDLSALALFATMGALVIGLVSMAHGGTFDQRHSHQMMAARVAFQAVTWLLIIIALFAAMH